MCASAARRAATQKPDWSEGTPCSAEIANIATPPKSLVTLLTRIWGQESGRSPFVHDLSKSLAGSTPSRPPRRSRPLPRRCHKRAAHRRQSYIYTELTGWRLTTAATCSKPEHSILLYLDYCNDDQYPDASNNRQPRRRQHPFFQSDRKRPQLLNA